MADQSDESPTPLSFTSDSLPVRRRPRVTVGAAILIVIASLAGAVCISFLRQPGESTTIAPSSVSASHAQNAPQAAPTAAAAIILVHVYGAVARSGLYQLNNGSRVIDAVTAAGGFSDNADQSGVNLARPVTDGEQLWLPAVGEAPASGLAASAHSPESGNSASGSSQQTRINLNTATTTELDTLPRIGPSLAARIVEWREKNGRFTSIDDLHNIEGFGEKTVDSLRDLVTV